MTKFLKMAEKGGFGPPPKTPLVKNGGARKTPFFRGPVPIQQYGLCFFRKKRGKKGGFNGKSTKHQYFWPKIPPFWPFWALF